MGKKADYPEFDLRDVYKDNSKNAYDIITIVKSLPVIEERVSENSIEIIGYEKGFFGKKLAFNLKIELVDDIITDPKEDAKIADEFEEEHPDWYNRFLGIQIESKYDNYSLELISPLYANPVYIGKNRKFIASYGYIIIYANVWIEIFEGEIGNSGDLLSRVKNNGRKLKAIVTKSVLNTFSPPED